MQAATFAVYRQGRSKSGRMPYREAESNSFDVNPVQKNARDLMLQTVSSEVFVG